MSTSGDDALWCMVMFDLPVKTKPQQRNANKFRKLLLDLGYWRVQYSIYVRFTPTSTGSASSIRTIRNLLPPSGEVRILHVTDKQWSKGIRFTNVAEVQTEESPEQLTIF